MKSTGMVKKLDALGRFVLPKELRAALQMDAQDSIEIYVDDDKIILKKYEPACIFCGNASDNLIFNEKRVCRDCIEKLSSETKTTV